MDLKPIYIQNPQELLNLKGKHLICFVCERCSVQVIVQYRHERIQMFNNLLCKSCKTKNTNLLKYGTESATQCSICLNKQKETNLKKYGVSYVFQNENVKSKIKKTNLEKYGKEYYTQTKEYLIKSKETCLKKYGKENYAQTDEYLEKEKRTNQKKLGVDFANQSEIIQNKIKATLVKNYGNANYAHRAIYRYDNIEFDSSWELQFYIYHKDMNHNIKREPYSFIYFFNGKSHNYFPDFEVNGQLYEIKGDLFFNKKGQMINPFDRSLDGIAQAKYICGLEHNVIFLKDKDFMNIRNYINSKYSKEYIESFRIR